MNPLLGKLHPYPFERWRLLAKDVVPSTRHRPISLGIGEPRHPSPALVKDAITTHLDGLASYPATIGDAGLRGAMAAWASQRYGVTLDPATQLLPVNGSREALFAIAQTVIDPTWRGRSGAQGAREAPIVVCPNPFYQIYEGAALLAGAETAFANSDPARNFAADWAAVAAATWARTQLIYVCSPGNPTGAVMPLEEWRTLFELSDRYGFVIASDECYSEIYGAPEGQPPLGALDAARSSGRLDFRNLLVFTSLSKRSNVPGLRSGVVAGDAALIKAFLLYRTYHGSAMSPLVQAASAAAWGDEAHVRENRAAYRRKFARVTPMLATALDVRLPDAGFYLWAGIPPHLHGGDDIAFALGLLAQYNVTVLPGSLLARSVVPASSAGAADPAPSSATGTAPISASSRSPSTARSFNPGAGRLRLALVADADECEQAAERILAYIKDLKGPPACNPSSTPPGTTAPPSRPPTRRPTCARRWRRSSTTWTPGACAWPSARASANGRCTSGSRRPCCCRSA
jgi:N-succinyldiaminopimelate aminotransferase